MLPNTDKQSEKQNMIVKMAGYLEKKSRMVSFTIDNVLYIRSIYKCIYDMHYYIYLV